MENRGFTLVELLAVIAIMGILMIMITPGIMSLRQNVLENALENRISMIENAAKDYAQEHITLLKSYVTDNYNGEKTKNSNCEMRNVNFFISEGYISSNNTYVIEDEDSQQKKINQIINPVTGESMNNLLVCMRFDTNDAMTRKVIAYVIFEE